MYHFIYSHPCIFKSLLFDFVSTENYNDNMIVNYSEIVKKEGSVRKAQKAIKEGKYRKLKHGIYSNDVRFYDSISIMTSQNRNITLTMQSAFEYYDLTDFISEKEYVATPAGSRMLNDPNIVQSFMNENIYNVGRVKAKKQSDEFYIYDLERMLIELMRNKSRLPYDYYKSIVQSYRKLTVEGKIDYSKVLNYLKNFKNKKQLQEKIMEIII